MLSEQFLLALPKSGSERLAACVKKTRAFVLGCLREGRELGTIRGDLPAEALAPIVMGTVHMLALASADSRHPAPQAEIVRDTLLALLRPPAAPPPRRKGRS